MLQDTWELRATEILRAVEFLNCTKQLGHLAA